MFIFAFTVVRYLFRALCRAYVRRLDMDDTIANGSEKMGCAGDGNAKPTGGASHVEGDASANGDYAGDASGRESTTSESEGGDA